MRICALAIAAAAALFASPLPAFSQGVEIGPGGVRVQPPIPIIRTGLPIIAAGLLGVDAATNCAEPVCIRKS